MAITIRTKLANEIIAKLKEFERSFGCNGSPYYWDAKNLRLKLEALDK